MYKNNLKPVTCRYRLPTHSAWLQHNCSVGINFFRWPSFPRFDVSARKTMQMYAIWCQPNSAIFNGVKKESQSYFWIYMYLKKTYVTNSSKTSHKLLMITCHICSKFHLWKVNNGNSFVFCWFCDTFISQKEFWWHTAGFVGVGHIYVT